MRFRTKQLRYRDGCFYYWFWECFKESSLCIHIFWTDTKDQFFAFIAFFTKNFQSTFWNFQIQTVSNDVAIFQFHVNEVHRWASDKSSYEFVHRVFVHFLRRTNLFNTSNCTSTSRVLSCWHDNDTVCQCHRFCLVVSYVDSCSSDTTVDFSDFSTHWYTQFGIQVWQRFVHQEHFCITDNGTTHSHTLTLTTRKVSWFTIQEFFQAKDFCCFLYTFVDIFLAVFTQFQTKGHVVINSHVWVKSVVLEYHGDITVFRCHVVYNSTIDRTFTFCDVFKTSDHTKSCWFTTSWRTYENDKLFVFDVQVEVFNWVVFAVWIFFVNIFKI